MKLRKSLTAVTLAAMVSAPTVGAFAATDPAPNYATQEEMLKSAGEAMHAVDKVRAARLALFNNDIEGATARLAEARANFIDAEKKLNDYTIGDTEEPIDGSRYLPIDVYLTQGETFTTTQDNAQTIQQAAQLGATGAQDEAVRLLRLASVDVNVSAAMLPIVDAQEHLRNAQTAMDNGDYYKANVALKAFEDSIVIRSYTLDAIPQQGQQTTEMN